MNIKPGVSALPDILLDGEMLDPVGNGGAGLIQDTEEESEFFEGVEKLLEVWFTTKGNVGASGGDRHAILEASLDARMMSDGSLSSSSSDDGGSSSDENQEAKDISSPYQGCSLRKIPRYFLLSNLLIRSNN